MLTNSKIAFSVALVLATASAAVAAPKHAVRHQPTIAEQAPGAYPGIASAHRTNSATERAYIRYQTVAQCPQCHKPFGIWRSGSKPLACSVSYSKK
jgi:hypothetical protein